MILTRHEQEYILKRDRSFESAGLWPDFGLMDRNNITAEFLGRNVHRADRGKTENTYIFAIKNGRIQINLFTYGDPKEPIFTEDFDQIE